MVRPRAACATTLSTRDWFHKEFVPAVVKHMLQKGLSVSALLLLDNAHAHPDEGVLISSDKTIKAMFLPPNTTALVQPMDQVC